MSNRRYPAWQNGSWLALTELFYLVLSLAQNGVTLAKAVGLGSFIMCEVSSGASYLLNQSVTSDYLPYHG